MSETDANPGFIAAVEQKVADVVQDVENAVAKAFHSAEAEAGAVVAAVKRDLFAEFDTLVADVRKLEAHLGFAPKA